MIEVERLTKYYGPTPVLRDITFNVEPGEILGFLGPNGAGKTTTMRIITGYLPPTSGAVRVAGFDVSEKSLEARQHLGYLPETVPLYTELTPYEYLDFRGRITGLHDNRHRRARIFEVMDQLNVGDVANKLIGTLSRGYRQRVGLAQALLHNPDALILDEPTVGLDPVQITEVRELIKELGRNHTIILSTHLLPEVSMVCNRVVIIHRGRLVALDTPIHLTRGEDDVQTIQLEVEGTPEAILSTLNSVQGVAQARILPQAGVGGQGGVISSSSPDPRPPTSDPSLLPAGINLYQVEMKSGSDVRGDLAFAVVSEGYQLREMKAVQPTLEDVFIRVISQEEEAEEEPISEEYGDEDVGEEEYAEDMEEILEEEDVVAVAATDVRAQEAKSTVRAKRRARR